VVIFVGSLTLFKIFSASGTLVFKAAEDGVSTEIVKVCLFVP
jgi:hypothetical protein